MPEERSPSSAPPPPSGPLEESPLSLRLKANLSDEPLPRITGEDREALARGKLDATLKGWRLFRLLGTGPVTAAYEAYRGTKDAKERAVVKVMVGKIAKHERARTLFLRAAYAANRFNHSRVLPILEDGSDDEGAPFTVRPWADAEPLSDVITQKPLEEARILRMAEQVLDALEMAHAHGIVHGAIAPSNILINQRGSIRLCDFSTPPGMLSTRSEDLVLVALRAGPYQPPESATDESIAPNEQGDVYALGACMYYAFAQRAPRVNEQGVAVKDLVPLKQLATTASDHAAQVIEHALEYDPLRRYESAYAFLGDVRRVMAGRRPKLGDALAPVPSQSTTDLGNPPSSRRFPTSTATREALPKSGTTHTATASTRERRRAQKEWRGNIFLILAIAMLVGVATFVLVRERAEDARQRVEPAPSASSPQSSSP